MRYERLKELRKEKNLYQKEVGSLLNMKQSEYSRYEIGNQNITTELLIKLALLYNTSVDYILGLTDIKEPYKKIKKSN